MHLHSREHSSLLVHYNILIYSFEELIIRKLPVDKEQFTSIFLREVGRMEWGKGIKAVLGGRVGGGARPVGQEVST